MKILALESSAVAASVCLCEDEHLLAQSFLHTGFTHSQTLLPMVEQLLSVSGVSLDEIGLIGVAAGPGSFTGLRIGMAAVKGLAWAKDVPCAPCSTLEAMAWNAVGIRGEICVAMDARRGQIYNARFHSDTQRITRLCPDRAIALSDLCSELSQTQSEEQLVLGDGAQLCYTELKQQALSARLAPENLRMQSAWGVARCALELSRRGETIRGEALVPVYLRQSQAERERQTQLDQK